MNRVYWPMNRDGVAGPSRRDPRPDADPPYGPSVLPGSYKVIVSFGDFKDSTMVNVKADPRLDFTMAQMRAKDAAYREYEEMASKAAESYNQLKEVRKSVKRVETLTETLDDEAQKTVKEKIKTINKELDRLDELFFGPENRRSSNNLSSALRQASRYIGASAGTPNQGAQRAMATIEKQSKIINEQIKPFMEGDFADFQKEIEARDFSLFKNINH